MIYSMIIEEIPSDLESFLDSDNEVDSEPEFAAPGGLQLEELMINDSEQESEDEIPISSFKAKSLDAREEWTQNRSYVIQVMKLFEGPEGPNVPEELETPADIFIHLFSSDILDDIVFQTTCEVGLCLSSNKNCFKLYHE